MTSEDMIKIASEQPGGLFKIAAGKIPTQFSGALKAALKTESKGFIKKAIKKAGIVKPKKPKRLARLQYEARQARLRFEAIARQAKKDVKPMKKSALIAKYYYNL